MKQMICIVGPTATGKTKLSVALAQEIGAEIVSCDSMQLYRGMDIGTAKPTVEEMGGIAHHMIDCIEPEQDYSVGQYVQEADRCIQDILSRGKAVIIVGGTGLYVDSLIAGREFAPYPETGRREELYQLAHDKGIQAVYDQLKKVDPEAAARIPLGNEKRVIRALEIYLETGMTMTQHNLETQQKPPKYQPTWIGLDYVNRAALYARIDRRVEEMLEQGLVEEVRRLLQRGIPVGSTALQAIGYKELVAFLQGKDTLDNAKEKIQLGSRHYAKRQRTWFRRNAAISWLEHPDEPNFNEILSKVEKII